MSTYLIINLCIIIVPLLLVFERKIKFYKKLIPVVVSILITGFIFLAWDIIAVSRGDWSFNSNYVSGFKIINLPFEEILFFVTVPFSMIFLYEGMKYYFKNKNYVISGKIVLILAIIFLISGVIYLYLYCFYTSTVFLYCSFLLFSIMVLCKPLIVSRAAMLTMLFSFIPFFIVNYILTSLPVVIYNPSAITGIRFLTIPFEDFFYSFAMISSWLIVYKIFERKLKE